MPPTRLILLLARAMSNGDFIAESRHVERGIHWRATWLGGGRLRVLGYPGCYPTDEQMREEDPTRVDELVGEQRELLEAAMTRRAWRLAQIRARPIPRAVGVRWVASVVAGEA